MSTPLLDVESVWIRYERKGLLLGRGTRAVPWALRDVSLRVSAGEAVGIVGESGSGKSTLARAVVGLVDVTRGRILLEGSETGGRRDRERHRVVQMVFQDPYSSLNPRMTVRQTLEEVIRFHRLSQGPGIARRSTELCDLVQLPATAKDKYPYQMSGGQRQRVALARALATEPKLLIADEPTSALDVSVQAAILNLMCELRATLGLSLLLISHNLAVVRHVCSAIAVMHDGEIVEHGTADQILTRPQHAYTRTLLAAVPSL
jgi:ABC-type glutathione transport system ATPase component